MSKFQVGDRVRLTKNVTSFMIKGVEAVVKTHYTVGSYLISIAGIERIVHDDELEFVSAVSTPPKRVKITVEAPITEYNNKAAVEVGGAVLYLSEVEKAGGTVEYLPEPIVLPTKRYAVVWSRLDIFTNNGGRYWYKSGEKQPYSHNQLTDIVNIPRDVAYYRVIFEGED